MGCQCRPLVRTVTHWSVGGSTGSQYLTVFDWLRTYGSKFGESQFFNPKIHERDFSEKMS